MTTTTHAYWLGIKDGFAEPIELGMGITWPAQCDVELGDTYYLNADDLNEAYDQGANLGQIIGWLCRPQLWKERPQPWAKE